MVTRMEIRPADYDVFRNDIFDVPEQACTGGIECAVRDILEAIGEDANREGLLRTPGRVARMVQELTAGYHVDPVHLINDAVFDVNYDQMVIVRDIDFHSLCERISESASQRISESANGVKKANARMVTSAMLGVFKENLTTRNEFFDHIGRCHLSF
jgi:GTP cyclohydrolase I